MNVTDNNEFAPAYKNEAPNRLQDVWYTTFCQICWVFRSAW